MSGRCSGSMAVRSFGQSESGGAADCIRVRGVLFCRRRGGVSSGSGVDSPLGQTRAPVPKFEADSRSLLVERWSSERERADCVLLVCM